MQTSLGTSDPSRRFRRPVWSTIFVLLILCLSANTIASPATNGYWRTLYIDPAIYDTPYRISLFNPQNGEDGQRVWDQTKSMFIYGMGVFAVLYFLPEDFTGWDRSNANMVEMWRSNVKDVAVWDRDEWYINYIGHPYFGGVYYQVARKSGYRQWDAFIHTVLLSTFYWEYGVEAFAEEPSIQDLVIHPLMGWVYGEWAYQTEQKIRANGNTLGGSAALGSIALALLDPIDSLGRGINHLTGSDFFNAGHGYLSYTASPNRDETDHRLYLNMEFPLDGPRTRPPHPRRHRPPRPPINDPVDNSIVGISIGCGHTALDAHWGVEDDFLVKTTLGLYFTPRFSARLNYAQGELRISNTAKDISYENYGLETQYFLRPHHRLRPYLSAGFGEQQWEQSRSRKYFHWTGGIGLHYQPRPKLSLQIDWAHHLTYSERTHDQTFSFNLIYRFGRGEHHDW